jgi:ubiquinone/menaquinone biosynthesis C-methylase UbiE
VCFYGKAYDLGLGPFLKSMKRWVASYIHQNGLFPVLDLCTGTGAMCRILGRGEGPQPVLGIDLDWRILDYARSRAPQIPFVQGDAAQIPFADSCFRGVIVSYALHDKENAVRDRMMREIRRVLHNGEGRLLLIDFENPWNTASRLGRMLTYSIERMAGGEHFRNGQRFLREGGLRAFLARHGWQELDSLSAPWGNTRIVVAHFPD